MLQKKIDTTAIRTFKIKTGFLLVFGILSLNIVAQNISFKKLNLDNGLSEITAFCVKQDDLGRMWIGTRDGLNCWDGIRMKTFYPEVGDTTSILDSKTIKIHIEGQYLWALSDKGVSELDLHTMKFKRFYNDDILCIGSYNKQILAGTREGLLVYNKEKHKFEADRHLFTEKMEVMHIYEDRNNSLWLGNTKEKKLIKIDSDGIEMIPIPCEGTLRINQILLDTHDQLWIATRFHGLFTFDPETREFKNITEHTTPFYLDNPDVRSILEDEDGRLWAGTFKGLVVFDLNKKTTKIINDLGTGSQNISHNSVYSLYLSNDHNIWVGTYFGGVNYGRVSNEVFKTYHNRPIGEKTSHNVIGNMIEDEKGNLWIATEGGGLDYLNRKTNTITNYSYTGDNNGPSEKNIKQMILAPDQKLMIGTYKGGLNILDLKTKKFKHYNDFINKKHPVHVNAIVKYDDKYLLGAGYGVYLFDPETEEMIPFFPSLGLEKIMVPINTLHIDKYNILWVATQYEGLISYNFNTKEYKNYTLDEQNPDAFPSNAINYILEDRKSQLWIGTGGGGFCLYDRNENEFTTYNHKKNNIPSDFIYGIVESGFGNYWISTSKGLSRFDFSNNQFFNYTNESGFPLKELNYNGLLLTNDNQIFVGGVDGLISFDEKDLLLADETLPISFTQLFVNNNEVMPNDVTHILDKDISVTESFKLKPKHRFFTINYSSFNYNNTFKNKYQYQLEGFNDDWVNAEFTSSATYTNLNPGKYKFKVRATDVAYKPVSEVKWMEITVKPPITHTWYAFIIYGFILIGIILVLNYSFLSRVRLQDRLKNEMADKNRIEELNVQKLRFFTNITHEFMTPLTIILSSLESAVQKYKIHPKLKWHLNLVMKNAKHLKNLNSELLDFRKIEQGHLRIQAQENDLIVYLKDIFNTFEEIARHKNIDYTFDNTFQNLSLYYDPKQLNKVFYNLLSNAFKHAPSKNGKITMNLIDQPNSVAIQIIDNGTGISKEDIDKIFDRFFQKDGQQSESTYQGSGIGLALTKSIVNAHHGTIACESQENEGTMFLLTLLKGKEHFSEQELAKNNYSNQFTFDRDLIWMPEDSAQEKQASDQTKKHENAPRLLVVEDNYEIRSIIKSLFEDTYDVITAEEGLDGLEKALKDQPDVIISDVIMPNLSGFDLCQKLKRNANTSHIPILLLTALDSEEDRTLAFKYGADSYCTKPFNTEMLKARIENLFNNRKIIQERFNIDIGDNSKSITQNVVDNNFLKSAQKIVEDNLLNPELNVDYFANEMKLGRTIFFNKIKNITGQTPNEYIQIIRLKKAADMLINSSNKTVAEIAFAVGFNSPKYFATAFKKHFGVTPSKYVSNT